MLILRSAYKKIGKLRTVTASDQKNKRGVTIIIQPYFAYTAEDTEFYEELSRKNPEIKNIIIDYTNLFKIDNNNLTKEVVSIKYSNINKINSLEK